jgi:hypothetical protein
MHRPPPLIREGAHGQIDHLVDRSIRRKNVISARALVQRHLDRRRDVDRINDPAYVFRKSKQRDHFGPLCATTRPLLG